MISKELVGASVRPILLSVLNRSDSYGYDIIQQVKSISGGHLVWRDGSLYPVLHRMEDEGFIESYWKEMETGRRRKYYRISTKGKKQLAAEKTQWLQVDAVLAQFWGFQSRLSLK